MNASPPRKQPPEAYALTLEKRRLESLLREFRIPVRLARTITFHFFNDKKVAANDH